MSYLQTRDPQLFARCCAVRHLDARLSDVLDDVELLARLLEDRGTTNADMVETALAELMSELRSRVAKCEAEHRLNKE